MKRQKISGIYADAASFDGQSMTVCGWVRTIFFAYYYCY